MGQFVIETTFLIIDSIDPDNETNTIQIGKTTSVGCGAEINWSYGIAFNRSGEFSFYFTPGFGAVTGAGLSASPSITFSTAKTMDDVGGWGMDLGGGFSIPIYGPLGVGAGYDYSASQTARSHTYSISAGMGYLPVEFHSHITYTFCFGRNNVYE